MPCLKHTFYSLTISRSFTCFLITVLSVHLPCFHITQKDGKKGREKISNIKGQRMNSSSSPVRNSRKGEQKMEAAKYSTGKERQTYSHQGLHKSEWVRNGPHKSLETTKEKRRVTSVTLEWLLTVASDVLFFKTTKQRLQSFEENYFEPGIL